MAAHLACHNSNILPNSFPPPKPAAREYSNFIASEYQASSIMKNFDPNKVYVTGRHAYDYLEDDIPVLSKPVPTITSFTQKLGIDEDPLLCITPEKKSPVKIKPNHFSTVCMDSDLHVTPEKSPHSRRTLYNNPPSPVSSITNTKEYLGSSRTVRFDQNVEVCQLSPVSSALGLSPPITDINYLNGGFSSANTPQLLLTEDPSHSQDSSLNSTGSLTTGQERIIASETSENKIRTSDNRYNYPSVIKNNLQTFGSINSRHNIDQTKCKKKYASSLSSNSFSSDGSGLDSLSSQGSTEPESVETIDIVASDLRSDMISKSKNGQYFRMPTEEFTECVLTRPEFSSTLRVRKEMTDLQKAELDIANAVKTKLKTSEKAKTQVNEKAFSRVNQENFKYTELPGIEVRHEDAIYIAEENITAKAKPPVKSRNKPENNLQRTPDIMDFFDRNLQRETASFSLPGMMQVSSRPDAVNLTHAFDIYQHIRSWENW